MKTVFYINCCFLLLMVSLGCSTVQSENPNTSVYSSNELMEFIGFNRLVLNFCNCHKRLPKTVNEISDFCSDLSDSNNFGNSSMDNTLGKCLSYHWDNYKIQESNNVTVITYQRDDIMPLKAKIEIGKSDQNIEFMILNNLDKNLPKE